MDCSHPGFPSVYVMVQPQLRTQILTKHSLNGKVAFSIRCEMNNTTEYMNKSVGVSIEYFHSQGGGAIKNTVGRFPAYMVHQ